LVTPIHAGPSALRRFSPEDASAFPDNRETLKWLHGSKSDGSHREGRARLLCALPAELKGYQSQGPTVEAVKANIKEAVELYLETLPADERIVLLVREILTTTVEVNA
jgi:predicted RNase H-like HicB family nuclease